LKDLVHEGLEGCGCVEQPKLHDRWLEESVMGHKRGSLFVSFLDSDVVESPSDVHLGEVPHILETVDDVLDEQSDTPIFLRVLVQLSIVHDRPELAFFVFKEERACVWGLAWADSSGLQVFVQELVQFRLFLSCQ
jgi:hypothetical protein